MANPSHDLLPCPFCGGSADEDHASDCWFKLREVGQSKARMAEAWNRRATPPSPSTAPESSQFANRENGAAYNSRLTSEVDERAAFEAAARIAEGYGPGRPIAAVRPSDLIRGRWEGEQAASANIARLIRERGALASRPAEVDDEGLPPLPEPKYCADDLTDIFTAEQYRQGQRDAVAADRARRGKGGA